MLVHGGRTEGTLKEGAFFVCPESLEADGGSGGGSATGNDGSATGNGGRATGNGGRATGNGVLWGRREGEREGEDVWIAAAINRLAMTGREGKGRREGGARQRK